MALPGGTYVSHNVCALNLGSHVVEAGERLLRGLLEVWPDNKVIEDLHNVIRADTKKTHSSKRSAVRKQDVAIASKVLDS